MCFSMHPRDHKIRRMIARGESEEKAIEQIDTTDKARAAFVRQYLGLKWPEPQPVPRNVQYRNGGVMYGDHAR